MLETVCWGSAVATGWDEYVSLYPRIVHHALLHDRVDGKFSFVQHLVYGLKRIA